MTGLWTQWPLLLFFTLYEIFMDKFDIVCKYTWFRLISMSYWQVYGLYDHFAFLYSILQYFRWINFTLCANRPTLDCPLVSMLLTSLWTLLPFFPFFALWLSMIFWVDKLRIVIEIWNDLSIQFWIKVIIIVCRVGFINLNILGIYKRFGYPWFVSKLIKLTIGNHVVLKITRLINWVANTVALYIDRVENNLHT